MTLGLLLFISSCLAESYQLLFKGLETKRFQSLPCLLFITCSRTKVLSGSIAPYFQIDSFACKIVFFSKLDLVLCESACKLIDYI